MALHRDWDTEAKLFIHNLEDEDTPVRDHSNETSTPSLANDNHRKITQILKTFHWRVATPQELLTEIFGRYGAIKNVILSKDVSPGWAFIEYETEHMAMLAAKSLDGIIGKVIFT